MLILRSDQLKDCHHLIQVQDPASPLRRFIFLLMMIRVGQPNRLSYFQILHLPKCLVSMELEGFLDPLRMRSNLNKVLLSVHLLLKKDMVPICLNVTF